MIKILLIFLIIFAVYFLFVFFRHYIAYNKDISKNNTVKDFVVFGFSGFIANFFDTLGIGSFAILTTILKNFKLVKDKLIPGTLNVSCAIPVMLEAVIFTNIVKVGELTLISMIISATLGAVIGASYVSKLSERKIQIGMGLALIAVAFVMLAGQFHLMPSGGNAISLSGIKLAIGIVGNFIFGALMTLGIGIFAPCMALVYTLGMNPRSAFPIMMCSCAFLELAASLKFVKEKSFETKACIPIMVFGSIGVFVAAYIVKQLPLSILKWLLIIVMVYTSIIMIKKNK